MTREQFQQFWIQLQAPLKAKWGRITDADIQAIQGNLATFSDVIQKRYGELRKDEVRLWADRRHAHWSGNYIGYQDPPPAS
ncbi:hypothetical protein FBQ96_08880 [Nitrospirales bacterium NOB]|nr:MAG: hypothetical protein UZ03_NOB001002315 [Nitrospira sp. OLB3]MBV6470413.1 hypothetical protein [Nitrospirota bacterium]MCE7965881.1 hypothetical protein [Nitrospira sp. NTP2]MDL1889676.1 hypothetical protein [Nitrospirales bacterium NOB]MEB2339598.1 hypothetical protein [Nitrospirales bacterium]QOJ36493.1 MAG: hypothetical protein HRU82_16750 [Nitrospira sp.]